MGDVGQGIERQFYALSFLVSLSSLSFLRVLVREAPVIRPVSRWEPIFG